MLRIRKISLDDLKEVLKIEKVSFPAPWSESYFIKLQKKYPEIFLTAELQNKIVGYVLGYLKDDGSAFLKTLAVHPEFRQKGIGTKLINSALGRLEKSGAKEVFLHVRTNNQEACAFYQKNLFKVVKTIKKYYSNGDGACLMKKDLGGG